MSRSNFGWWGSELDEADFACALAAAGVIGARLPGFPPPEAVRGPLPELLGLLAAALDDADRRSLSVPWKLRDAPGRMDDYALGHAPDAGLLNSAWRQAVGSRRCRFEVQAASEGRPILPWIVAQLSRPEVGLGSVYVEMAAPTDRGWHWPVRVGFLPDAGSQRLAREFESTPWGKRLASVRTLQTGDETCDLLILPWSLRVSWRELSRASLALPHRPRAGCLILMGGIEENWARAEPLVEILRATVEAAGVCLADVPANKRAGWFHFLVENLSHDAPLDLALGEAARNQQAPAPLFLAGREFLAGSQLSALLPKLVAQIQQLPAETRVSVSDTAAQTLQLVKGLRPARDLAAELRDRATNYRYGQESQEASGLAELVQNSLRALESAPPAASRYIQGQLFETRKEGGPVRQTRALRAGARHILIVRIGPADREWLAPPGEAIFPENKLAWRGDHEYLQVVFSEPRHLPEPQTASIVLPRAGASTTCQFGFRPRADVPDFSGRVIVLQGNRVLQTAILRGRVVADPAAVKDAPLLSLDIEAMVRQNLQGLAARPEYDVAFIANHDERGQSGLTTIAEERATFRSLDNVRAAIDQIRDALAGIAHSPQAFEGLQAEASIDLLRGLAFSGGALYDGIVTDQIGKERLRGIQRVQLLSAREEYLPLEFLYDQPAPKEDAPLCPRAAQALRKGICPECQELGDTPAAVICPLGFWCLRLVIERHQLDPLQKLDLKGDDFALLSEPIAGRDMLRVLSSAVYAASSHVDQVAKGQTQKVLAALSKATHQQVTLAQTWAEWTAAVQKKPSLLLLLPHTSKSQQYNLPQLEIGEGQALPERHISEQHVRPSPEAPPPIVLLLGCETLAPDVPFQSFAAQFRRKGAAIVLATLSPVLGRHVGPVAQRLLKDLARAAQSGDTFGDALLSLRRRELAAGMAMVLCLVAYGDADWRLA